MNLLEETLRDIHEAGLNENDIRFIKVTNNQYTSDEHTCFISFETFKRYANDYYDSGYGLEYVNPSMIIYFNDGSVMFRETYDGSEWWRVIKSIDSDVELSDNAEIWINRGF